MNRSAERIPFLTQLRHRLGRVTSGGAYLPAIDGLRFVAILLVVIQHLSERVIRYAPATVGAAAEQDAFAFLAGRGTVGVFLFFAISGFILGLPFARRYREQQPSPSLQRYFLRRLTRLEPPYIFWMLVFTVSLVFFRGETVTEVLPHLGASLLYSHGWLFGEYSTINPVAWSLEVEVQFYLLAPFLAWIFFARGDARLRRFLLVAAILLSLGAQHLFGWKIMPWKASLLGQLPHFLVGFLLVDLYLDGKLRPQEKQAWVWDAGGVLALVVLLFSWSEELPKEILFSAALVLFFAAALRGVWLRTLLSRPWIAVTGGMCYTIYLIHLPLLELFVPRTAGWVISPVYGIQLLWQFLLVAPVVFLISVVAFLLFEKPFMDPRWPARFSFPRPRPARYFSITKTVPMRFLRLIPWMVLIGMLLSLNARSQSAVQALPPDLQYVYDEPESIQLLQLQPLPVLIEAAMANAPALKIQDYRIENQVQSMMMLRRQWSKNITAGGNFSLGNGQFLDAVQTVEDNSYKLSNRRNALYTVGVTVKIPLSDLMTRPAEIKIATNEVEMAILEKQQLEDQVRLLVTDYYNQLVLKLRILRIKVESLEFNRAASEMAEEYFREGAISLDEYTQSVTKKTRAEEEFESARSEVLHNFLLLRETVGTDISLTPRVKTSNQ